MLVGWIAWSPLLLLCIHPTRTISKSLGLSLLLSYCIRLLGFVHIFYDLLDYNIRRVCNNFGCLMLNLYSNRLLSVRYYVIFILGFAAVSLCKAAPPS